MIVNLIKKILSTKSKTESPLDTITFNTSQSSFANLCVVALIDIAKEITRSMNKHPKSTDLSFKLFINYKKRLILFKLSMI